MIERVTPIADMVREMLEKGVASEAIVIAVQGAELALQSAPRPQMSADESADRRREKDRVRKQIERENLRKSADVRGNPQMSENASLYKEEKKEEIKEEREASTEPRPRTNRGQRLPDDWHPSDDDWSAAQQQLGADRGRLELEKFRDHWKQQPGSRGVKLDWNAAWRNWIRRAAEYGARNVNGSHGIRTNPGAGSAPTRDATFIAAMGRTLERRRAARAADDFGRQELREAGGAGAAGSDDADGSAAPGDDQPSGQLALLPFRDTGS